MASTASSDTVTVACKLPHGLRLRIFEMVDHEEPVLGGGKKASKVAQPVGDQVVINGNAMPMVGQPRHEIVGGYGLTHNVNAEFFAKWCEQNGESDIVKNNLIFALKNANAARDKARDGADIRSGLEGIDPVNLPRGIQKGERDK
jgi:hypothetical protein